MIKGSIQEEDIIIGNIYAPNIGAPQYIRQILTAIKREINNNTIIVGNFNNPLSSKDRSSRQKINKETQALNDTLVKMDLIDIYRACHPKAAMYIFFSSARGTFCRIDHMLGQKARLLRKFNKFNLLIKFNLFCEIRNKLQVKSCKKHKHVEAKQYATKPAMDH